MREGMSAFLTGAPGWPEWAQTERLGRAGARLLLLDRPEAAGGSAFAAGIAGAMMPGRISPVLAAGRRASRGLRKRTHAADPAGGLAAAGCMEPDLHPDAPVDSQ